MAWYAKIEIEKVVEIIYVIDSRDSEWLYREFSGNWIKCDEQGKIRNNFPSVGFIYNKEKDCFYQSQPFSSWTLNEQTCLWDAPTPYPIDDKLYKWDEPTTSWVEIT